MKQGIVLTSVVVLLAGYLLYQIGAADLIGGAGNALSGGSCKSSQPMTKVMTLAEVIAFSEGIAKPWKADAALVRLDNDILKGSLQPDGSSPGWSVAYYSAAAKAGMQIHAGGGTLYCSTYRGEPPGYVPALKPDFTRDSAALYALAEKHGRALLDKGYDVGINLWANGESHHAMWHVGYYKREGDVANSVGPRLVVDANTGELEEIVKQ